MAISLQKGQKVALNKGNSGLSKLVVGLGWDTNKYDGGAPFDLDAAVFLLDKNGKLTKEADFVFYNNLSHESGAVVHKGDNLTGKGEGDDEQFIVDLSKVPAIYDKIDFTVTIHDADVRGQNFGKVGNAFIRIVNASDNSELGRFDLVEDYSVETAVIFAELCRDGGEWTCAAVGKGYEGGLAALCGNFWNSDLGDMSLNLQKRILDIYGIEFPHSENDWV